MIQPQRLRLARYHRFRRSPIDAVDTAQTGFTLTEVLVAILLTTTFVAVALQGMVVAMLLKSKSFQMAEASRWVDADLEGIRSQLTLTQLPMGLNQSRCHPASADKGFADLIRDNLAGVDATGTADYQLAAVTEISKMGKTFQIARTLSIPATSENTDAKILGIQYRVSPTSGTTIEKPILHFYTEVIPDAALQCQ
jgi:Prokaryotic N-terminal methylation motif